VSSQAVGFLTRCL